MAYNVYSATDGTPIDEKPNRAQYHAALSKDANEEFTFWAADLDIGEIKEIMVEAQCDLTLCGNGKPYYLMFKDWED